MAVKPKLNLEVVIMMTIVTYLGVMALVFISGMAIGVDIAYDRQEKRHEELMKELYGEDETV